MTQQSVKHAKAQTRRLVARLKALGVPLSYGQGLEALAAVFEAENWHVYAAALKQPAPEVPAWDREQGPMSDEQYRKIKGLRCPCCGSDQIEGNSFDVGGGDATQEISCNDCCATWLDVYNLTGYSLMEEGSVQQRLRRQAATQQAPSASWYTLTVHAENRTVAQQTWLFRNAESAHAYAIDHLVPEGVRAGIYQVSVERQQADSPSLGDIEAWLRRNGLTDDSLDDWVHDVAQELALDELNELDGEDEQESLLRSVEHTASDINNGGLAEQLSYLARAFGDDLLDFIERLQAAFSLPPLSRQA